MSNMDNILSNEIILVGDIVSYYIEKNFDYPEKPLKYKHIRRISD